ncbi:MAG: DEAD/DEAH box helicase, partial [Anaerolineales bacterium]|nr:DEAD/DEAH box helicase [Anaerolineales bacterium]
MTLKSLLAHWRAEPSIGGNIVHWHRQEKRSPSWARFPTGLHPALAEMLHGQGIQRLYSHQEEAFQMTTAGHNCVIATGTASGKTLCFNLPVINSWLYHPSQRAIYLYPTKALAQDQFSYLQTSIAKLNSSRVNLKRQTHDETNGKEEFDNLIIGVYDGDTTQSVRAQVRAQANIIFTNPDMLHTGIMPHHTSWAHFFSKLKYVVIDEMHMYRGVFGSHVANVLRRLKRICNFYGSRPQFILTSATIGNPKELAERLIAEPVSLVSEDGSARGAQEFLIYNPPIVDR